MYRVGDVIAEQFTVEATASGGMGLVLIVRDRVTGVRLAAKTIKDDALSSAAVRDRFHREARTWVGLGQHENLVSALFFREIEERPFLFLEYVDGEDLKTLLARGSPVPLAQVLDWGLQLCRGMAHAHRTELAAGHPGIVHRDLKPSNLFVTRSRVLKVSDFGMAKLYDRALESTAEGIGMGTPFYMPPEQLRDARSADARADVYAAGMVLYELTTGVLPLRADRIENQVFNILNVDPPPASSILAGLPPDLDVVLARCLEKRRERRFDSFPRLAEQLAAIADALGGDLADAGACCEACGLPTRAAPGTCPLCGGETRAGGRFRGAGVRPLVHPPELPGAPVIRQVEVRPRVAHVGREIVVSVSVVNPGGAARDAVLDVPPGDAYRHPEGASGWRGVVPPCDEERPFRVELRLVPLREGAFDLPPLRLSWKGAGGRRRTGTGPAGPSVTVEFSFRLPLVGREADLEAFRERLRETRNGEAGAFALVGDLGHGRTRVLEEMAEQAEREGFLVLRGKAVERGVQPLKALHDGLVAHCGLAGRPARPDEILAAIIDRLSPHLGSDPDLVAYLADFLAGMPPLREESVERIQQRWARLYCALAASRPVALVLDDLHWSEGETREVLVHALRRARSVRAPLLIVASWLVADPDPATGVRIERLEETVLDLRQDGVPVERRVLGPLTQEEIEQVVELVFPGSHFEADHPWFPRALAEVSAGRPYFLLEILRTLRVGGSDLPVAERVEGSWRLDPDLDEDHFRQHVPVAVEEVLLRRMRALPEGVREILEMAALIGEEFEVNLLAEAAGGGEAVDRALEELERAEILRPVDATLRRYRFPHALAGSALARAVVARSPRGAMRRHRAIAAAMRRCYGSRGLRRRAVRLGRHLVAAGEVEEGFRMLLTGVRDLVTRQAYPRAWSALTSAGAALESRHAEVATADRIAYLLLRGEVAKETGRYAEGLVCFRQVVEEPSEEGPGEEALAEAYSKMGRIHEHRGEYDEALFCYSVGKDLRSMALDEPGLRRSLNNIGRVQMRRGESRKARASFEEALDRAERAEDRAVECEALLNLGTLELGAGRSARAGTCHRRALRLARSLRNRRLVARAVNGLGNVAFHQGRLDRALTDHRRALAIRRALGDREGLSSSYNNLGAILASRGHAREALDYYERSATLHRDLGSRSGLAAVLGNIGQTLLRLGDVSRAQETATEAVEIRRELGDLGRLGTSLLVLGETRLTAGDEPGALAAWQEARDLDAETPAADLAAVLVRIGQVAFARGDREEAARRFEEARQRLGDEPDPEVGIEVDLADGELALAEGRLGDAESAADRAGRCTRRLSIVDRARARRLRGRLRCAAGRVADGIAILRRVARDLEAANAPVPARAEALLDLGRALAGTGRSAREVLEEAARSFEDLVRRGRHGRELEEIRALSA